MKKQIAKFIGIAGLAVALAIPQLASAAFAASSVPAPESPRADMREAARDLERAGQAFSAEVQSGAQNQSQTSWSDYAQGKATTGLGGGAVQQTPGLVGSPETGYAGVWTDPDNGDIVTTVIAPTRRPVDNYADTPIVVQPDIGAWNNYNYGSQGYNPQWSVAPGSPGYPGSHPGQRPYPGPPSGGYYPSPGHYPPHGGYYPPSGPNPPPGVNPNYRPLRPNPGGNNAQRPPKPEFNIPGWKPFPPIGNRPFPGPVQPEYNIPGWKPFPPAGNGAYPPGRSWGRGAWR